MTTFTNWSLNLVLAQCAPLGLEKLGFSFFYFFFAWNVVAAVCYTMFYPETKGKTLEQMDEVFGDQVIPSIMENPDKALDIEGGERPDTVPVTPNKTS